ncbi:MAG TPA: hypothetical protein PLB12_02645 [Candidatus Goldiibacteriota bacterium]|nr:hypothetical protein [Candidatus Goldiibacteriota bacterium]HPI03472.1 hypothetical protein [Candidatus Goldiibacteriota bacterium]HRQ43233.1 hypothetical protein [Candidatus Goldiibacteriota bacterium]
MSRLIAFTASILVLALLSTGCADNLNTVTPTVNENSVIIPVPAEVSVFPKSFITISVIDGYFQEAAVMNGVLYASGGTNGISRKSSVYSSADGENYNLIAGSPEFSARTGHAMITFNNVLWIVGGYDGTYKNDVWYSADGINWIEAAAGAAFSPRHGMTLQSFKGNMWLIGGTDSKGESGDIYWSLNGAVWVKAANAPEGTGLGHTSFVFNGKMYIISVVPKNKKYDNPLWVSDDGITWTQADKDLNFGFSHIAGSVIMNNKIYVLGDVCAASADATAQKGDVYESEDGLKWEKMKIDNTGIKCGFHPVSFGDKLVLVGGY